TGQPDPVDDFVHETTLSLDTFRNDKLLQFRSAAVAYVLVMRAIAVMAKFQEQGRWEHFPLRLELALTFLKQSYTRIIGNGFPSSALGDCREWMESGSGNEAARDALAPCLRKKV